MNKYVTNAQDSGKHNHEDEYIFFCDINNQYGWAMSQNLPEKNFEWEEKLFDGDDIDSIQDKILKLSDESSTGYIFDVDLIYPKDIHDLHNEFPLCPEQIEIKDDLLSDL